MLYYLFEYLESQYQLPGASLFQFLSFRAALAVLVSLLFSTIFGKKIIDYLKRKQIGETVRELGLEGQAQKSGTPTMGGIIIIISTLIPVLLIAKLQNIYILLLIFTTLWMGAIGFLDDYIKVFRKDKQGLKGIFKVIGQVFLGVVVGSTLYFHSEVTVRLEQPNVMVEQNVENFTSDQKSTLTTIPFLKNNEFDYAEIIQWIPNSAPYSWLIFIPFVVFIITAISNGANLTDGIDGLAAGSSAIMVFTLGVFAWVSGNLIFSDYLNIMYIPNAGEITIFIAAFLGSLIGFLWYNTYPAQVFMGDTGSLTIGAIIAVTAIMIRKELLLPLLCGVFVLETLSVVIQV
ncbi:MAG: phospho-N-acetylmuramoyl-pentapeptide-transferase, partial [Flavobacteriaceae bacterium]|nr:phospho-N-acetylmuramoyl-pentapeptide-transferase [Flavobacteriaceae bacterium]